MNCMPAVDIVHRKLGAEALKSAKTAIAAELPGIALFILKVRGIHRKIKTDPNPPIPLLRPIMQAMTISDILNPANTHLMES